MKIKNIKRTIFILLAFLVTAFCGISLVKIITFVNNNPAQKDIEAAEEWRGSGVESDPYLIESISGMNSLASKVSNGESYSGVYFKLTVDLDFDDETFIPVGGIDKGVFSGNFDGGGHTISNAYIEIKDYQTPTDNLEIGIFSELQVATIRNLKSEGFRVWFSGTSQFAGGGTVKSCFIGGIAGEANGCTINNCEVEGLSISGYEGNKITGNFLIGGIVGYCPDGENKFTNCVVKGLYVSALTSSSSGFVDVSGITNKSTSNGSYNIDKCFTSQISLSNSTMYGFSACNSYDFERTYPISDRDWGSYDGGTNLPRYKIINSYVYNSYIDTTYPNLGASSTRGNGVSNPWYFDSNYTKFPYLRIFMKWVNYEYKAAYYKGSELVVAKYAGTITSNLTNPVPLDPKFNGRNQNLVIMGITIEFDINPGYTFDEWTWVEGENEGDRIFMAVCELDEYTIKYYNHYCSKDETQEENSANNPTSYTPEDGFTLNSPNVNGYDFTGWSGTELTGETNKSVVLGNCEGFTGDREFTAHFTPKKYTITYDLDGGSLPSDKTNPSEYTIESDEFTLNNPTKKGYFFAGWAGTGLSDATETVKISKGSTGDREYTATWREDEYSITYVLNGGTAEQDYKSTYTIDETELILNYTPTKDGCVFVGWSGSNLIGNDNKEIIIPQGTTGDLTFEANWKNAKVKLLFEDLSSIYSDVTNSTELSYDVAYNTQISLEEQLLSTGIQLVYEFNDYDGNSKSVFYNIPNRYEIISEGDWEPKIPKDDNEEERFIDIDIAVKNYSIDFGGSNGSWGNWQTVLGVSSADVQSDSSSIEYGQLLEYDVTTENITIKLGNQQRVFTPNDGYEVKCLEITYNGTTIKCYPGESGTITVTSSISINAVTIKLFKVTFAEAVDENGETGKAQLTASTNPITIRNGDSVTGSFNNSTITYKYKGNTVATYTLEKYYTILNDEDMDEIENVNDTTNLTIQPTIRFHACLVTFENVSKDDKDSNKAMATMSVEKDNYPTNNDNDGIFVVEFNTTVNAVKSGNSYIYTFSSGEVVTFTVEEKYEIESYGLDSDKEETHYEFSNQNEKEKTISPTFKVKKYKLTIIKNGEEVLNEDIYHSSKINYSANLSVSNNSYFEFEYDSLYNEIEPARRYKQENWFLEYFIITNEGESPEKIYIDNTILDNIEIMVDSNVSIELQFVTFHKIGFETNIEGTTFNSEYADEINVKSGSSILGSYNPSTRLLQYTLTYNAYEETQESVVAEYTLMQYYLLIDADNIDSASEDKVIKPIIEFGACRVFMGDISNKYGVRDGLASFVVEFGTEVEFKAERKYDSTKDCYNFIYTYTFALNGSTVQTVIYTVLYDDYAMFSDLTKEGRVWHTNITSQNLTKTEIREDNIGKVLEIRPEFGYKKFDGEMS